MPNTTLQSYYVVADVGGVLTGTINKRVSVNEFRTMLIELRDIALEKKVHKLLLNGISVDFNDVTLSERHDIGLAAAEILKGDFRAALVIRKEFINKHGENVANNRGATVLVIDSLNEAYEWLMK